MKKSNLIIFLVLFILTSCGTKSQSNEDNYDTTSKIFESKIGKFIVNLPAKPKLKIIDNQIGSDKYKIYYYQTIESPKKIYSVEYIKIPKYMFDTNYKTEDAYTRTLKALEIKYNGVYKLTTEKKIKRNNIEGCYYQFSYNTYSDNYSFKDTKIKGILFFVNSSTYNITYHGIEQENIDKFLNSFEIKI